MTPRSLPRAGERKTKQIIQPAVAPMPIPYEPEPVPVLPPPEVELPPVSIPDPASAPSGARVKNERKDATEGVPPTSAQSNAAGNSTGSQISESIEDFFELAASLVEHYHPATVHECSLVEDLACERWFLLRRQRAFNAIEAGVYETQSEPAKWSETEFKRLALADRYRMQAERTFESALDRVQSFCKERVTNYRWEAMYDLAVRHLEFEKKKHELDTGDHFKKMDVAA
jgi:hypothetical protein